MPFYCSIKGVFVADLVTGHLVMALIDKSSEGVRFMKIVHKACANPELTAFAESWIGTWAGEAMRKEFPKFPEGAEIHRQVTACLPTAPNGEKPAAARRPNR